MNEAQYREVPGIRSSDVKRWLTGSPKQFQAYQQGLMPQPTATSIGTALHSAILDGHLNGVVVPPYEDFRTKDAREWRDRAIADGKVILKSDEMADLKKMIDSVRRISLSEQTSVGMILDQARSAGLTEKMETAEFECIPLKCRFDCILPASGMILDLKSSVADCPEEFAVQAGKLGYDIQAIFYEMVAEKAYSKAFHKRFQTCFIVVEKQEPFDAWIQQIEIDRITVDAVELAIREIWAAERSGNFPGWGEVIHKSKLKPWAIESRRRLPWKEYLERKGE